MREIKFRVWDKEEQEMLCWDKFFHFDIAQVFESKGSWGLYPMQYTGLKDKNGIEIYEGDIVQIKDHAFQRKEGSLSGINIDGNYVVGYTDRMELVCGSWLLWNQRPYITVIGNIYENPELLEG